VKTIAIRWQPPSRLSGAAPRLSRSLPDPDVEAVVENPALLLPVVSDRRPGAATRVRRGGLGVYEGKLHDAVPTNSDSANLLRSMTRQSGIRRAAASGVKHAPSATGASACHTKAYSGAFFS
jgi:hypothetical protein